MGQIKKIIAISISLFVLISTVALVIFFLRMEKFTTFDKTVPEKYFKAVESSKTNPGLDDDEKNAISIYESLSPAVVNITVYKTEYYNYFFEMYPQKSEGVGSGVIIDRDGYVITNYHVVGNSDKVTVALSQNEQIYEAGIIGVDPENDLAVIKIKDPPKNLTMIPLGASADLKVGQKVYAIGNPFGLDRTLTSGIISGLGRPIKSDNGNIIANAIQTDASINPGNSGGPLIDSSGRLIGINTMIISPSGGSIGLGFAIPIETARDIIPELIKSGYIKRGWIDASYLPVTPAISKSLGYSVDYGLMIMSTAKNGEAYKAGLKGGNEKAVYEENIVYIGGDIIISVDNVKINDYSALVQVLKNKKPGETVTVEYVRNGRKNTTKVKLVDKYLFLKND